MDRYASKKCFSIRTSKVSNNRKTLGKKNPTGSMAKRQADGVIQSAQRLLAKPFVIGGEEFARRGFETVIDKGYGGDSKTCLLCGDSVCKVNFLKIPFESLIRFKQENYSCSRVIRIFAELKSAFSENENVKTKILNIKTNLLIQKQNNRFLFACFETSKIKILSEIYSLEKQAEVTEKRYFEFTSLGGDVSFQTRRYNKIQNRLEFWRKVLENVQTLADKKEYLRLKSEFATIETQIKKMSKFAFPILLSKEEEERRIENVTFETSAYKQKGILKRCAATQYTLSLG